MDRSSLSRTDFARDVRSHTNARLRQTGHHPGDAYTPSAFRHYVRRIALLEALGGRSFQTALDVGCSEGFFMQALRERFGAEVWGVDLADAAAESAHRRLGAPTAAADAIHLPFADGAFDLVYSTEVIEHVLDPELMLAEMRRVSRGLVLVTTPVSPIARGGQPDYEQADVGHVNDFDRATVRRIFGPDAQLDSFRCNAGLALIVAVGRYLPPGLRDGFYAFDHLLATHLGDPYRRFKPLRNRDWLITVPGLGQGRGQPCWRCPGCRGELAAAAGADQADGVLRCTACRTLYRVRDGVPDFFEPMVAAS